MLHVIGSEAEISSVCVNADHYVPLRMRTYVGALGGIRDVRYGDEVYSLFELKFALNSGVLRGFTLLMCTHTHTPISLGEIRLIPGLPIVDLENLKFEGREFSKYVNDGKFLSVGVKDNYVEISFADHLEVDTVYSHHDVQVLVFESVLVGLRVTDLSRKEIDCLSGFRKID